MGPAAAEHEPRRGGRQGGGDGDGGTTATCKQNSSAGLVWVEEWSMMMAPPPHVRWVVGWRVTDSTHLTCGGDATTMTDSIQLKHCRWRWGVVWRRRRTSGGRSSSGTWQRGRRCACVSPCRCTNEDVCRATTTWDVCEWKLRRVNSSMATNKQLPMAPAELEAEWEAAAAAAAAEQQHHYERIMASRHMQHMQQQRLPLMGGGGPGGVGVMMQQRHHHVPYDGALERQWAEEVSCVFVCENVMCMCIHLYIRMYCRER